MLDYFYQSGIDWIIFLQSGGRAGSYPCSGSPFLAKKNSSWFSADPVLVRRCRSRSRSRGCIISERQFEPYFEAGFYTRARIGLPPGCMLTIPITLWHSIGACHDRCFDLGIFRRTTQTLVELGLLWSVIVMIGVSLFLGVHFPIDVILGWDLWHPFPVVIFKAGNTCIGLAVTYTDFRATGCRFGGSLLLVILGALILALLKDWSIPMSWIEARARLSPMNHPSIHCRSPI